MALIKKFENGKTVYEGPSGTKYEYDLSNPMDKQAYELDLAAQMRDQLSLNLYKNSENGGGIYE
ncbi:hypothetical protein HT667_02670 [Ursidibacter maritimus]|uniref:hypothetical protein n=1 Tax=Ursidibacter maritimus TaxID=1331689 RepID=UPI001C497017|nr:hypothetical protein [Ursidibacter maritimus]MBV6540376.1 hypothetical protein [Ursidibacter maritimus]